MAAPLIDPTEPFDPLVDLAGLWTTRLAERYLPLDDLPPAKYECVNGRLIMSPREGAYQVAARAVSGQEFRTEVPFPIAFDPLDLLEPGVAPR